MRGEKRKVQVSEGFAIGNLVRLLEQAEKLTTILTDKPGKYNIALDDGVTIDTQRLALDVIIAATELPRLRAWLNFFEQYGNKRIAEFAREALDGKECDATTPKRQ